MSLALTPAGTTRPSRASRRSSGAVVVPLDRYREPSRHPAGRALRQAPVRPAAPAPASVVAEASAPPRLRLTSRGRGLVRLLVLLAVAGLVLAGLLASRTAFAGEEAAPAPVRQVVVLPGDTLWSIAGEVAPESDRRETVSRIVELNELQTPAVSAGQPLLVPGS